MLAIIPRAIKTSKFWKAMRHALIPHDRTYNADYYANEVEPDAAKSAHAMATSITLHIKPRTVIDVGCGTGALLAALRGRGCKVRGLEYSDAGITACRLRKLEVVKFDITTAAAPSDRFDLAVSFEVAEHLPAAFADRYVRLLCALSDTVIISAAVPGQGGTDHVNEQPHSYWIEKFNAEGFLFEEHISSQISREWTGWGVAPFYAANVLVFRRQSILHSP